MEPTIKEVLAIAKTKGCKVTRSKGTLNGSAAYKVDGHPALYTKGDLMKMLLLIPSDDE
jgi:hypothetical protein